MLNRKYAFFSFVVVVLLLSSCGVSNVKHIRSGTTMPDFVKLELTMDDYEYLGETEIQVEYHKYFGIFTYFKSINGETVDRRDRNLVYLSGRTPIDLRPKRLNRAVIKAYKEYPEADFLMPVMITVETEHMFLGRKVRATAKIISYKIRK